MDHTEKQNLHNNNNQTPDDTPRHTKQDIAGDNTEKEQYSFYECPTAACSIISVGAHQDSDAVCEANRFNTCSLDGSENETATDRIDEPEERSRRFIDNNLLYSLSGEGGSVSYSALQQATGGYAVPSGGMLVQGSAVLSERPRNIIPNSPLHDNTRMRHPITNVRTVMMTPTSAAGTPMSMPPTETPAGRTIGSYTQSVPQSPITNHQETAMGRISASTPVNVKSPAVKDYSRAVDCGNTSETSFVHEGYDTIQVPRYRPVEVVEKIVEVPVVHHVDTYVPKKEVQEIESFVRTPYTKYVDKFVEVPEIHYNDKIVEVPEYHEVTKTVQKVEIQERIKYVPKMEVKVVPKYVEVPVVKIVDRYEEYEEVEEVIKHVEKREVVEVPRDVVKHVVKPVKKIIEQERIIPVMEHRDVPVEKIKFVPKIETVELTREIPKIIDVPVPYNVFKVEYVDQPYMVPEYRDVPVAVPVRKVVTPIYHYQGEPEVIDVPVHKPYLVIHDHISFKPASYPVAENIKVVGTRPIDINTLSEAEKQDVQTRMQRATKVNDFDNYDKGTVVYDQKQVNQPPKVVDNFQYVSTQSNLPTSLHIDLPVTDTLHFPPPTFNACARTPTSNNRLENSLEAIIYTNSPPSHYSPMSDGVPMDAYPPSPSNIVTPRIGV
ncbi:putative membrane skeletal protein [Babesia divergens]|uniref:Membrane skeletal protein n=1 Tax=Babesia divergens TaxID=32595 RepID=A0AAD9LKB9_BABDI|nr:putative membrane skeletal protein [Babesia divergens]